MIHLLWAIFAVVVAVGCLVLGRRWGVASARETIEKQKQLIRSLKTALGKNEIERGELAATLAAKEKNDEAKNRWLALVPGVSRRPQ